MLSAELSERVLGWRARLADLRGRGVYAGYSNDNRCIFVHIPKTAGSSVARALFGIESRHVPADDYRAANPRKFEEFFKFGFVRNPWDRLVSTYAFLKAGGMNALDAAWAVEHVAPFATFDDFVREKLATPEVMAWVHFRPQTAFVCDEAGRVLLDVVGRYERLDADFARIAARLGRPANLPKTNVSRRSPYPDYYTAETRDLVRQVYASDIETFGYAFEP